MKIFTPDIKEKIHLPQVYPLCGGDNISPEVKWEDAPVKTKSFALTFFDPDAPSDHGWWHWLVVNIPLNVTFFPRNAGNPVSEYFDLGFQTINDYGEIGYGGPCPPPGDPHRYILSVYALSVPEINLSRETNPQIVAEYIKKYSIDTDSVMGLYKRGWE